MISDGYHDRPDVDVPIERVPAWANTHRIVHGISHYPTAATLQVCVPCDVWWARSVCCWVCGKPGRNLGDWLEEQREERQRGAA